MKRLNWLRLIISIAGLCTLLAGCNDSDNDSTSTDSVVEDSDPVATAEGLDSSLFVSGALVESVTTESCVLSGGTETTCYRIEIAGVPADREVGPFCPPTIFSEAEEAGIWFDGGGDVYDLDGEFIVNLSNLYGDSNWFQQRAVRRILDRVPLGGLTIF